MPMHWEGLDQVWIFWIVPLQLSCLLQVDDDDDIEDWEDIDSDDEETPMVCQFWWRDSG